MNIGQKLRNLRNESGATLKDVAGKADISIPYLSDIERGNALPPVNTLELIATALDCTLEISFIPKRETDIKIDGRMMIVFHVGAKTIASFASTVVPPEGAYFKHGGKIYLVTKSFYIYSAAGDCYTVDVMLAPMDWILMQVESTEAVP